MATAVRAAEVRLQRSGRTLEETVRSLGDPADIEQMVRCEGAENSYFFSLAGDDGSPYAIKHNTYWRIRNALLATLFDQLKSGKLVSTGFEVPISPQSTREIINPELWNLLEPDFENSSAEGAGLKVVDILIFEASEMSGHLSVTGSPERTENDEPRQVPAVSANEDYSVVRVDNVEFQFGHLQAAVVRELHRASRTQDSWRSGKVLLGDVGSETRSIGDLFRRHTDPSWRLLIDERRGKYRLRVEP